MPGVSRHFYLKPLNGSLCDGAADWTLGEANEEQFVPVDNEIFISGRKEQAVDYQFEDGRSIARQTLSKIQRANEI